MNLSTILNPIKYQEAENYRYIYPKVRGGWTLQKIERALRSVSSMSTKGNLEKISPLLFREIGKFTDPKDFYDHLYFHGTMNYISGGMKAGFRNLNRDGSGGSGGYGQKYHSISLSKSKNIASNFTADSTHGTVHPILVRKDAVIIENTNFHDAEDLEDGLVDLWTRGIDAVYIGGGEEELVVLNPRILIKMSGESFAVYHKKKFENPAVQLLLKVFEICHDPSKSPAKDTFIKVEI